MLCDSFHQLFSTNLEEVTFSSSEMDNSKQADSTSIAIVQLYT